MTIPTTTIPYFSHNIQIDAPHWQMLELAECSRLVIDRGLPEIYFYRHLAARLNEQRPETTACVSAGQLLTYSSLLTVFRHLIDVVACHEETDLLLDVLKRVGCEPLSPEISATLERFVEYFPPAEPARQDVFQFEPGNKLHHHVLMRELLLLRLASENRSIDSFRQLLDDTPLIAADPLYGKLAALIETGLEDGEVLPGISATLMAALRMPISANPDSLSGQLDFVRRHWSSLLPPMVLENVAIAFDILKEEERGWVGDGGEPPSPPVMEFGASGDATTGFHPEHNNGASVFGGYDYPEHEAFSTDADWMSNVVLMAKMVYVWLDQLSRHYAYPITRLDQIPETELASLARRGFTGLWLIGIWERSPASQRIKEICGNPDAIASAYSLYDYEISADLGGWEALANLRKRALHHGIRLASDMVPNHTGIYSRWVLHHPDWFVQTDYPPFPTYRFTGEDLSRSGDAVIQLEDGYWTKTDAAVVFRMIERSTGRTRYMYHGNDGTTIPWNDTAQLNYMLPEVREAVIQTILHVARNFPIIRFDAAMTLAKKHYQRLWYPIRGLGGGIPSRSEHGMARDEFDALFPVEFWREVVDRVALEVPGTLLLAEAFWLMEGYFVRTLGMHRVYNSAFMNMLMKEENAKYRQTIKNVLVFNPEVLQRFVNFMNNPDEKTAVEQFGSEGKYFGSCLLLSTMPGLPMFGHGQIEGFREKYGMEYKRAYWDEPLDHGLIQGHEMWIFPILRKRYVFSGAENFALYDFVTQDGVDENVYAYSNRFGAERALVLFNNRHGKTAGWIRESSPVAITSGDDPELATVTIAEALAISSEENLYYAFHDHTRGLEYIRHAQELCLNGLYAELGEYEFHIFSNFRELRDHSAELVGWSALCDLLNGRGVENLEDEMKQLRYAELNGKFRTVVGLSIEMKKLQGTELPDNKDLLLSVQAFQHELSHLIMEADEKAITYTYKPSQIASLFESLDSTVIEEIRAMSADSVADDTVIKIMMTCLLLHGKNSELTERFGLDLSLRKSIDDALAGRSALLIDSLQEISFETYQQKGAGVSPLSLIINRLFAGTCCRTYMDVHTDGSVEWFNKERFEELLAWCVSVLMLTGRKAKRQRTVLKKEYNSLKQLAVHAGYRVRLFMELCATPVRTRIPTGMSAKKAGNKTVKTVQGEPR